MKRNRKKHDWLFITGVVLVILGLAGMITGALIGNYSAIGISAIVAIISAFLAADPPSL